MKNLILFLAIITIFTSCETESSDDIDVSAVYQSYYYKYDANENKTHAYAEFRDGGPLGNDIILYAPSAITMNGETMSYNSFPFELYYHYSSSSQEGEVKESTFIFTDKNSKTYSNIANLNLTPAIGFPSTMDEISKSHDLVIEWTGSAIADGQTVDIMLMSTDTSFSITNEQIGSTSITFPKENLAAFANGEINVYLERQHSSALQNVTQKGGVMELGYYTNRNSVIVD